MFEFFVFTVVLFGFWAFASHLSRGPADRSAKHWSSFGNVALRPKTWPPKGQIRRKLGSVDAAVLRNTGWVQKIQEKISGNHNWHCYLERLMAYIIMVYPSLSLPLSPLVPGHTWREVQPHCTWWALDHLQTTPCSLAPRSNDREARCTSVCQNHGVGTF